MNQLDIMVIKTSLSNMFAKDWFDICAVDKCLKLVDIKPDRKMHERLNALHCVHYDRMPKELQEELPNMVMGLFDGVQVDFEATFDRHINVAQATSSLSSLQTKGLALIEQRSWLKRLK